LCGRGDVNVYTVFAELFRNRLGPRGRFGAVLPSGIATDDTTKFYFQDVIQSRSLVSFYDFENKNIFPEVHSSYKFCLITAGSGQAPLAEAAEFAFFCHAVDALREPGKRFSLSPEDIKLLNPNTRTCPIFRSTADAELTKWIYRRVPVLIKGGGWGYADGTSAATVYVTGAISILLEGRPDLQRNGSAGGQQGIEKVKDWLESCAVAVNAVRKAVIAPIQADARKKYKRSLSPER